MILGADGAAMGANGERERDERRFLLTFVPLSAFVGGLCCFTPVATVLLGLGSVSYAASLTDLLYYEYAWAFRLAALGLLLGALAVHLRRSGEVCTLEEAVRKRRRIANLAATAVALAAVVYVLWLYVVVELAGLALGIW
jgi:hypothetical protein